MEGKRPKGVPSVVNIPHSVSLFKFPRSVTPLFSAVPPTLFAPSPMIDIWGGGDGGWRTRLSPLFPGLSQFPSPSLFISEMLKECNM